MDFPQHGEVFYFSGQALKGYYKSNSPYTRKDMRLDGDRLTTYLQVMFIAK
jgi:hypothetical protein